MRWLAKRSHEIQDGIAGFLLAQQLRRCTYNLENNRNAALFTVKICNRERNALTIIIDAQYNELPRQSLFSYPRRLDVKMKDTWRKLHFLQYLKHV